MGIQSYGLFGSAESNNSYGPGYEIKRQLATRQAQLDALSNKDTLTTEEQRRKEQLTNTVNQLNDTLNKRTATKQSNILFGKPRTAAIHSVQTSAPPAVPTQPQIGSGSSLTSPYTQNFTEGSVIAKSPYRNPVSADSNSDYLKGFFLDLKI